MLNVGILEGSLPWVCPLAPMGESVREVLDCDSYTECQCSSETYFCPINNDIRQDRGSVEETCFWGFWLRIIGWEIVVYLELGWAGFAGDEIIHGFGVIITVFTINWAPFGHCHVLWDEGPSCNRPPLRCVWYFSCLLLVRWVNSVMRLVGLLFVCMFFFCRIIVI